MSDELLPQAGDEAAVDQASTESDKTAKALERANREAANYRVKLREVEAKLKEVEPILTAYQQQQEASKTDAQRAIERAAELERKLAERERAEADAQRLVKLTKLATKAGVDLDLVDYLDTSKLNLDDEKGAVSILSKLATKPVPGARSNPSSEGPGAESIDARRARLFTRNSRNTLLGG